VLNYSVQGEGQPIVYLHGFLESSTMWSFLDFHEFNAKNIFIDLPGHGQSDLTDFSKEPSLDFMANEVSKILNLLQIETYSVIGHSMGGYVGLLLKKNDSRCKKVVLLNSNFWNDTEQKKKDRVRVAEIAFKAKKIFIQEAIPNLFGKPENFQTEIFQLKNEAMEMLPESIAYASLAMRERKDFTDAINSNPVDYFIIHGMLDRLVDTDFLRRQLTSDKNLFIIENAGHMAHIEQSENVQDILKQVFS
jgi:2-succinyl-6-hydroxy-2,4-cyclohexadiene-1-carboxylate synthase